MKPKFQASPKTMTQNHAPREEKQPDTVGKDKKPYRKPTFRYERVFETLALSCGKTTGGGFPNCNKSRKAS